MLVCPQCSAENPTNHKFCQKCGFSLVCRWAVVIDKSQDEGETTSPQGNSVDSPPRLFLGARYQKISEEFQSLPNSTFLLKVLDTIPNQTTPLLELIKQQPTVADVSNLGKLPSTFPEWELWERGGVNDEARPYLALQKLLSPHVPQIFDTWHRNGQLVIILEYCHEHLTFQSQIQEINSSSSELLNWLKKILDLWSYLEPWSVRMSLLDINNLFITKDRSIYLQRLIPEQADEQLSLHDLINSWLKFLPACQLKKILEQLEHQEDLTLDIVRRSLNQNNLEDFTDQNPPVSHHTPTVTDLKAAAASDNGKQRDHNEDYFSIETIYSQSENPRHSKSKCRGLYILCDGMGGHASGEIASSMAIEKLQSYWDEHWHETLPTAEEIEESIIFTNQALFEINQTNAAAGNGRMGTTLVMVMIQDHYIAISHVGDSRCYLLETNGNLVQITLDHEVGQREILRGVEPEIAYGRPDSYQLTQAIGPRDKNSIAPDIQFFGLREDTLILIASDGLTDQDLLEIHGEELLRPMLNQTISLSKGVNQLVEFGNSYNGHDNITAIAVLVKIDS